MTEPIVVRVNKADGGPEPVRGAIIEITREQPVYSYRDDLAVIDAQFDADAEAIEDALYYSLPGGTYDRLCGRMLARKATHFRVAHLDKDSDSERIAALEAKVDAINAWLAADEQEGAE